MPEMRRWPSGGVLIRDTVAAGLVKPVDPNTAPRHMRYVPYWA